MKAEFNFGRVLWVALFVSSSLSTVALARIPLLDANLQPSGIADDKERDQTPERFVQVPNFPKGSIEFISDGDAHMNTMKQYLKPETISEVMHENFVWLQIRDVRIDKKGLANVSDGVLIPIIVGVRYMQSKNWVDGTVNVLFHVTEKDGKLNVELVNYDDNAAQQVIGRWYSGLTPLFTKIAGETLNAFFSQPGSAEAVMNIRP